MEKDSRYPFGVYVSAIRIYSTKFSTLNLLSICDWIVVSGDVIFALRWCNPEILTRNACKSQAYFALSSLQRWRKPDRKVNLQMGNKWQTIASFNTSVQTMENIAPFP